MHQWCIQKTTFLWVLRSWKQLGPWGVGIRADPLAAFFEPYWEVQQASQDLGRHSESSCLQSKQKNSEHKMLSFILYSFNKQLGASTMGKSLLGRLIYIKLNK